MMMRPLVQRLQLVSRGQTAGQRVVSRTARTVAGKCATITLTRTLWQVKRTADFVIEVLRRTETETADTASQTISRNVRQLHRERLVLAATTVAHATR